MVKKREPNNYRKIWEGLRMEQICSYNGTIFIIRYIGREC
jgi:hypothetical protein